MVNLILAYGRLCDSSFAGLLRFGVLYIDATACIFSIAGNYRYMRELSAEREMLQA